MAQEYRVNACNEVQQPLIGVLRFKESDDFSQMSRKIVSTRTARRICSLCSEDVMFTGERFGVIQAVGKVDVAASDGEDSLSPMCRQQVEKVSFTQSRLS